MKHIETHDLAESCSLAFYNSGSGHSKFRRFGMLLFVLLILGIVLAVVLTPAPALSSIKSFA